MKHRLVVIGWMSIKTAYLDLTKKEAMKLYLAMNPDDTLAPVREFEFNCSFGVYDAWQEVETP